MKSVTYFLFKNKSGVHILELCEQESKQRIEEQLSKQTLLDKTSLDIQAGLYQYSHYWKLLESQNCFTRSVIYRDLSTAAAEASLHCLCILFWSSCLANHIPVITDQGRQLIYAWRRIINSNSFPHVLIWKSILKAEHQGNFCKITPPPQKEQTMSNYIKSLW